MWQYILDNNLEYALICQDDVYFVDDFKLHLENILSNMPPDTDIINIGLHEYYCYAHFVAFDIRSQDSQSVLNRFYKSKINDFVGVLNERVNTCSLAYIMTRKGAQQVIDYTKNHGVLEATDNHINKFFISKGTYYGSLRILATGEPSFGSDIF